MVFASIVGSSSVGIAAPPDKSYKLVFEDSFEGTSLNKNNWTPNWLGCPTCITPPVQPDNELAAYDPAQVSVRNGVLLLRLRSSWVTVNGRTYPYRSGMVTSYGKKQFKYGYFEARIHVPASSSGTRIANWPAWWTNGESWPTDGENDVMEGLSGSACYHFHSPQGGPGRCVPGDFTGWHNYGALWEPGKVTYYYDDKVVGTITSGITTSPMYLILNYGTSPKYGGDVVAPNMMRVAHVRVYNK
jgi:beta-glucanase (GH16 family)